MKRAFIKTGHAVAGAPSWKGMSRSPGPLETSRPGIFAPGDVRSGSLKRCPARSDSGAGLGYSKSGSRTGPKPSRVSCFAHISPSKSGCRRMPLQATRRNGSSNLLNDSSASSLLRASIANPLFRRFSKIRRSCSLSLLELTISLMTASLTCSGGTPNKN
jgi:hypothetical protein